MLIFHKKISVSIFYKYIIFERSMLIFHKKISVSIFYECKAKEKVGNLCVRYAFHHFQMNLQPSYKQVLAAFIL